MDNVKLLGVSIEIYLKWDEHSSKLCQKLEQRVLL